MDGEGPSILIVEDDPALRLLCRVNLELEHFRVREADTLETARYAVNRERPSLVFLDLHLGAASSEELLDELICAGVPVVVVSGTIDVDGYAGRASAVLPKPFDPAEFVEAARRCAAGDVGRSASLDE